MSESVNLPALGECVTEVTVTRLLKKLGDRVEVDEPLLEVATEKLDTEIQSPVAGIVEAVLVREGGTVKVGTALMRIGDGSGAGQDLASAGAAATPAALEAPVNPETPAASDAPAATAPAEPLTAPAKSGPVAPVGPLPVAQDAETAPAAPAPVSKMANAAPSASTGTARQPFEVSRLRGTTMPMTRLRKVIAERAVVSMTSTAQVTIVIEVDVSRVARLRDKVKGDFFAKTGAKLSFLPFFAMAAAEALRSYPMINCTVDGGSIVYPAQENLSIAVDTERGLMAPVIRGSAELDIAGLATQITDLAERTRNNQLKPNELSGGTFTLTNTGSRGALFDTPVVFLPQSAILGTGAVVKRPKVVSNDGADAIAVRSMVYLALSYDYRIIGDADAARFLTAVKERLEEGAFEPDLGI